MFAECLKGVWRVSGGCLEGVWKMSLMCLKGNKLVWVTDYGKDRL